MTDMPTLADLAAYHRKKADKHTPADGKPAAMAWHRAKAAWHGSAARQIEALAGQGWIHAPDLPPELEGSRAWRWLRWDGTMELVHIPRSYDRRPLACDGVWFWPLSQPAPPAEGGNHDPQ